MRYSSIKGDFAATFPDHSGKVSEFGGLPHADLGRKNRPGICIGAATSSLEAHIRKEERVLFPCYERNISLQRAGQVKNQVSEVIGSALKKHPELLE